jgi:hypothetical protein
MNSNISLFLVPLGLYVVYRWVVPAHSAKLGSMLSKQHNLNFPQTFPEWESAFASATHGHTHYHLLGPHDGKKVEILIKDCLYTRHNLTTNNSKRLFGEIGCERFGIITLGFRVLCYDMYGRGYSGTFY